MFFSVREIQLLSIGLTPKHCSCKPGKQTELFEKLVYWKVNSTSSIYYKIYLINLGRIRNVS